MKRALRPLVTLRYELSTTAKNLTFLLAIVGIAIAYTFLAYREANTFIPTWPQLWEGCKDLVTDSRSGEHILWIDTKASFGRLFPAVALAGVLGTVLGMYMGLYQAAESFFARILEFMGNIAPNAMMVVFMSLFGFELEMYMAVIMFGIITMIAKTVYLAVKAVPNEHVYRAQTLGASNQEVVWSIVFAEVRPQILEAVRASIAPGMIFLIAAEWISGSEGFGYRFMMLKRSARMEVIFPYLMYLGLMGMLTTYVFTVATRLACPWYFKGRK